MTARLPDSITLQVEPPDLSSIQEAEKETVLATIRQEYEAAFKVVRERDPAALAANKERAIQQLKAYIAEKPTPPPQIELVPVPEKRLRKWLRRAMRQLAPMQEVVIPPIPTETPTEKMQRFADFFEEAKVYVFYHGKQEKIEGTMLKSPQQLANEAGQDVRQFTAQSGSLDIKIGNTQYVFAASKMLKTRSVSGPHFYQIDSDDGYAVPLDLADVSYPVGLHLENEDLDRVEVIVYAHNLYTITDFKEVFAWYASAFFDKPDQALEFYRRNHFWLVLAAWWDEKTLLADLKSTDPYLTQERKADSLIKLKMVQFFKKTFLIPPLLPEFQFPNQVEGRLVDETEEVFPVLFY